MSRCENESEEIPLTLSRKYAALLFAALAGAAAAAFAVLAQQRDQISSSAEPPASAVSAMNTSLVVIDPAHGGTDSGAALNDHAMEKDVTLAIAVRLRSALMANGFTVVATREADVTDLLPTDQRAETANRTHAVACIVIHATAVGSGVHVYTSDMQPPAEQDEQTPTAFVPIPWDTAQAKYVRQSLSLASNLSLALGQGSLPALVGHAPLRPLDNMMCPAVAIEVAPLLAPGVDPTPVTDANYQQHVVSTLTAALRAWRANPGISSAAEPPPAGQATAEARAIAAAEAAGFAAPKARHVSFGAAQRATPKGLQ